MSNHPILIYLAGPQDDVSKRVARGWREKLASSAPAGVAFFSPAHAYMNVNRLSFRPVDHVNRLVINAATAVIANLSGQGRGFGTVREIEYAVQVGTPVQVIGPVSHSLMTWDLTIAESLEEALDNVLHTVDASREAYRKSPLYRMFEFRPEDSEE